MEEERGEDGKAKGATADTGDAKRGRNGGKSEGGAGKKKVDSVKKKSELKEMMTLVLKAQLRGEQRMREVACL